MSDGMTDMAEKERKEQELIRVWQNECDKTMWRRVLDEKVKAYRGEETITLRIRLKKGKVCGVDFEQEI